MYRNVTLVGGGSAAPYGARLLTAEYLTALAAAEAAAAAAAGGGGGGSSSSLSALLGGATPGGTEVNFRQRRNGAYLSGRAAQVCMDVCMDVRAHVCERATGREHARTVSMPCSLPAGTAAHLLLAQSGPSIMTVSCNTHFLLGDTPGTPWQTPSNIHPHAGKRGGGAGRGRGAAARADPRACAHCQHPPRAALVLAHGAHVHFPLVAGRHGQVSALCLVTCVIVS